MNCYSLGFIKIYWGWYKCINCLLFVRVWKKIKLRIIFVLILYVNVIFLLIFEGGSIMEYLVVGNDIVRFFFMFCLLNVF